MSYHKLVVEFCERVLALTMVLAICALMASCAPAVGRYLVRLAVGQ